MDPCHRLNMIRPGGVKTRRRARENINKPDQFSHSYGVGADLLPKAEKNFQKKKKFYLIFGKSVV